ncbi:MerR family transcriptional regulator [Candidatus Cyanaurora vandensis]|uniref:MerR family transcriptional regulator n=1 Tax=Candidatus Cyanaurora vandensis TaxID=2714958 RepID=UPI00257CE057|nr:MerR family transcriptional regulator [Candidatus Cyanaurora vandensis]
MMKIGALAERAGVAVGTIRYYETLGLLKPTCRSESGYRHYDQGALERLYFIKKAQALQFSLTEIRQVLAIEGPPCTAVQELLNTKIAHLEVQLLQMQSLKSELEVYRDRWASRPTSIADGRICSLIDEVEIISQRTLDQGT